MEHDHLIFFVYTVLNTISRVVARQVSVRLERRMYVQNVQNPVCEEVVQNEEDGVDDSEDEMQDEETA